MPLTNIFVLLTHTLQYALNAKRYFNTCHTVTPASTPGSFEVEATVTDALYTLDLTMYYWPVTIEGESGNSSLAAPDPHQANTQQHQSDCRFNALRHYCVGVSASLIHR